MSFIAFMAMIRQVLLSGARMKRTERDRAGEVLGIAAHRGELELSFEAIGNS